MYELIYMAGTVICCLAAYYTVSDKKLISGKDEK